MRLRSIVLLATIAMVSLWNPLVRADTTQTWGEGSAVTSIDRSATFDALNFAGNGTPLSDYVTANLNIFTNGNSYVGENSQGLIGSTYFNPFHITAGAANGPYTGGGFYFPYDGQFGNQDWISISAHDNAKIYAVEFLYGNGWTTGDIYNIPWGSNTAVLEWKTLVGTTVVSSNPATPTYVSVGSVVGFVDPNGFDSLMVRCPHPNSAIPTLQELALDNLIVQVTPVPEPSALLLLGAGLMALTTLRPSRRAASNSKLVRL